MDTLAPLIICFLFATAFGQWTAMPGPVIHVSARGGQTWTTTETSSVLYSNDGVTRVFSTGGGQFVSAASDGRAWLLRTDLYSENLFRFNPAIGFFEHLGGTLRQISSADGDNAVGVNYVGDVWRWQNNAWTQLPGKCMQVSMGVDRECYCIDPNCNMYHLVNGQWQWMGVSANYIDAHDQNNIVRVDGTQDAYVWNNNQWKLMSGQKCVKVTYSAPYAICQDVAGGLHKANVASF